MTLIRNMEKGLCNRSRKALIFHLFNSLGVNAVYGDCDVRNIASWKLLERLGFHRMQQLDNQSYKNDREGNPILISAFLYGLEKGNIPTNFQ